MYARNVTLHLKADKGPDFTRTLENEVLPMLRKQSGFEGTPEVDSYEVSNSTFHKIASQNSNQAQPVTR